MFYTNGVRFEDLNIVLKIYKKQSKSLEEVLSFFSNPQNQFKVNELYPSLPPITIQDAIKLSNTEQRMTALRIFSPEEIAQSLNAKVLNEQTVHKKQIRWDKNLKPYEHSFEDTYTLYQISASEIGIEQRTWWISPDIYFVKCKCASSDRIYYIYVPKEAAEKQDALEAIAWTMQINGKPINKAQYLSLMYSET